MTLTVRQKLKRAFDFRNNVFSHLWLISIDGEPAKWMSPYFKVKTGNINQGTFKLYGISE